MFNVWQQANPMTGLITNALVVYAVTFIITMSHIMDLPRVLFRLLVEKWWGKVDYDFISCRMCVGFWVTLAMWPFMWNTNWYDLIAVYGLSYFLATQERP